MKTKLIILLSIIWFGAYGQGIFDNIDTSMIKDWNTENKNEFQAVYHFGDSEWESHLTLIFADDKWYAQIKKGSWSGKGNQLAWIYDYENLSNVRIIGNKFYSDKTNGEFVYYDGKNGRTNGLKVYNSWSGEDGNEIGYKSHSLQKQYSGNFTQASIRLLVLEELEKMSKTDLKIMRNEIFARYGYKFKPGGEMDNYFQERKWYKKHHDTVNEFLTDLEKENIKLIQEVENRK
ncbi:MAG: YARHG domain-containing protein [Bacteroidales bacterium]|nr:YARHG domain-containing protein [Bacteroidales bacterium]